MQEQGYNLRSGQLRKRDNSTCFSDDWVFSKMKKLNGGFVGKESATKKKKYGSELVKKENNNHCLHKEEKDDKALCVCRLIAIAKAKNIWKEREYVRKAIAELMDRLNLKATYYPSRNKTKRKS
ncbi:unnamed protein product [Anisakis simplex]|uniref:Transposase n=1 Tax=Anisakis simplex TaxID=6269 RepID=A0A0M3JTS1_ANISI|nr:unnamed protein product [Anisakis simplex]